MMQSTPTKLILRIKKDENSSFRVKTEDNGINTSTSTAHLNSTFQEPVNISSSEEDEDHGSEGADNQSCDYAQNQLVVYDPAANAIGEVEAVPDPVDYQSSSFPRRSFPNNASRVLPSVGAFTVQCANCFKWRLIPTKEKYEEIREHILEQPFLCEAAREWRPDISCDDEADISQDGSRLWAIDKPNIAQPPPGWERLLRIRGEGSTKFADVYYVAPSGKRLRSMVEVHKYLLEHPEYMEGVTMSQFSFQTPKPLQENYVRKRPARLTAPYDDTELRMPLEPSEVSPISWAGPDDITDLRLGQPGFSTPYLDGPFLDSSSQPAKKQARRTPPNQPCGSNLDNQQTVEEHPQARYHFL